MAVRRRRSLLAQPALTVLLALAAFACRSRPVPAPAGGAPATSPLAPTHVAVNASEPAPASASPGPPPVTPPLSPLVSPPFVALPVAGFGDAVVSVPSGATEPRAIALALHGNFDRPEWQCDVWRRITHGEVFVLCPRGVPRRDVPKEMDRWEWGSLAKTKAELLAALSALRARYPAHVREGAIVFTGFSLGAILGATLIQDQELNVGAAVLVEGGYQGWTRAKAKALQPRVRRLLWGCGQTSCRNAYRYQLGGLFEAAGLPSSMVADVKAGHTYDDPVASLIEGEWPALLSSILNE